MAAAAGETHNQPSLLYSRRNRGRSGEALVAAELCGLEWSLPIVYRVPLALSAPRLAAPAPSSCNADACSVRTSLECNSNPEQSFIVCMAVQPCSLQNTLVALQGNRWLQAADYYGCAGGIQTK